MVIFGANGTFSGNTVNITSSNTTTVNSTNITTITSANTVDITSPNTVVGSTLFVTVRSPSVLIDGIDSVSITSQTSITVDANNITIGEVDMYELFQRVETLEQKVVTLEQKVGALESANTP
jgi:hypothetical protein